MYVVFVLQAIEMTFHRKTLLVSEYVDKIMQRTAFLIMSSIGTAKVSKAIALVYFV